MARFSTSHTDSTADAADAAVQADTNITIETPSPRMGSSSTATPPTSAASTPVISPGTPAHDSINWGGVVKGVAIVAAIAVVAVVGFALMHGIAAYALAHGLGAAAGSAAAAATPVTNFLAPAAAYITHFNVLTAIPAFFGHAFGIGAAQATSTALLPATASAIATGAGALGAGIAGSLAIPFAIHHMDPNMFVQHHAATAPTVLEVPSDHGATPTGDNSATFLAAKKAAAADSIAGHGGSSDAGEHAMGHDTHLGHHAAEESDEHHRNAARAALERAARANQSWASRAGVSDYQANRAAGGHAAAVRANLPSEAAMAPRATEFTQQIDADRAKLDAALAPAL